MSRSVKVQGRTRASRCLARPELDKAEGEHERERLGVCAYKKLAGEPTSYQGQWDPPAALWAARIAGHYIHIENLLRLLALAYGSLD